MRILVGYLATPSGEDGLQLAVRTARSLGASIDICLVIPPERPIPGPHSDVGFEKLLFDHATEWVTAAAAQVPDDIEVTTHVSYDESFAEGLLNEATRLGAEAIVIGAAGDGLLDRHSIGTVANELLHSSHVPVVLAPKGFRDSTVDRVRELTCALGTRPGAYELLQTAVRACRRMHVPLRLVSLVSLAHPLAALLGENPESDMAALEHAREALEKARAGLPEDLQISAHIAEGPTIESAIGKLEWHDGDVLIVGSSRLAAPRHLFLGSTAAKMLRVVPAPMIVVPKPDEAPTPDEVHADAQVDH